MTSEVGPYRAALLGRLAGEGRGVPASGEKLAARLATCSLDPETTSQRN